MAIIRQQIVDAIAARLGQIAAGKVWTLQGGGSYTCGTTLVGGVTPWRKVPYSLAQVPALAFWDTVTLPVDTVIGEQGHELKIEIAGFMAGGTSITAARTLLADISAAIGNDPRWTGLAMSSVIEEQAIDVEQAGDVIAAVQVTLTITYTAGLWRL